MTQADAALAATFWKLFSRVLGRPVAPGHYTREELPEWDSLRHIELVFELEQALGIEIDADAIADLYADTDRVLAWLAARVAAR